MFTLGRNDEGELGNGNYDEQLTQEHIIFFFEFFKI
jgi:hypothetical protein